MTEDIEIERAVQLIKPVKKVKKYFGQWARPGVCGPKLRPAPNENLGQIRTLWSVGP